MGNSINLPKNCKNINGKVICKVDKEKLKKLSNTASAGSDSVNIQVAEIKNGKSKSC